MDMSIEARAANIGRPVMQRTGVADYKGSQAQMHRAGSLVFLFKIAALHQAIIVTRRDIEHVGVYFRQKSLSNAASHMESSRMTWDESATTKTACRKAKRVIMGVATSRWGGRLFAVN